VRALLSEQFLKYAGDTCGEMPAVGGGVCSSLAMQQFFMHVLEASKHQAGVNGGEPAILWQVGFDKLVDN